MYYCIVNPSARSGKGKDIWEILEKRFKEKGLEYKAHFTEGPGHATRLAKALTDLSTFTTATIPSKQRSIRSRAA